MTNTNRTSMNLSVETYKLISDLAAQHGVSNQVLIARAITVFNASQGDVELKIPGLKLELTDTHLIIQFRGVEIPVLRTEISTLVKAMKEATPPKAGDDWLNVARSLNEISLMRDGQGIKLQHGDKKLPLSLDLANFLAGKIESFSAAEMNEALSGKIEGFCAAKLNNAIAGFPEAKSS